MSEKKTDPLRPGVGTSEWWITVVIVVVAVVAAMIPGDHIAGKICLAVLAGGSVLGYTLGRGYLKGKAVGNLELVEQFRKLLDLGLVGTPKGPEDE